MSGKCRYEPVYPPAWTTQQMNDVDEDYYEIPRGLLPPGPKEDE